MIDFTNCRFKFDTKNNIERWANNFDYPDEENKEKSVDEQRISAMRIFLGHVVRDRKGNKCRPFPISTNSFRCWYETNGHVVVCENMFLDKEGKVMFHVHDVKLDYSYNISSYAVPHWILTHIYGVVRWKRMRDYIFSKSRQECRDLELKFYEKEIKQFCD